MKSDGFIEKVWKFLLGLFYFKDSKEEAKLFVLYFIGLHRQGVHFSVLRSHYAKKFPSISYFSFASNTELLDLLAEMERGGLVARSTPGVIHMHQGLDFLYSLTKQGREYLDQHSPK